MPLAGSRFLTLFSAFPAANSTYARHGRPKDSRLYAT